MARRYNLKNIRALLTDGFTSEELRRFCYDEPNFRGVYNQLSEDVGKDKLVDLIVEHADQSLSVKTLLAWAKEHNPTRYSVHQPYYWTTNYLEEQGDVQENPRRRYNLENISRLLSEGFTDEELRQLCYYEFRPVYDRLAKFTRKSEIVYELIEYANRRLELEKLLALAEKHNLAQYERHQPYYNFVPSPILSAKPPPTFPPSPSISWKSISISAIAIIIIVSIIVTLASGSGDFFSITGRIFVPGLFCFLLIMLLVGRVVLQQLIFATVRQFRQALEQRRQLQAEKEQKRWREWENFIHEKLIKQNYVELQDLNPIPKSKRKEVLELFKAKTHYDVIYNAEKKCLMYRYWPKLKKLDSAWKTLEGYLNSDLDTFATQWATFARTFEDALGVGSVSMTQSALKYNRIVGYKVNVGNTFAGLNLPRELVFCIAQYPQPSSAQLEDVYHLIRYKYHTNIGLLLLFSDNVHTQQTQLNLDRGFRQPDACDIIALTYTEISSWVKSDNPLDELRRKILKHVSLKAISPFVINGPTSENMFFGRENELRQIRDHLPHQSFAITGGRRIGKTSIAQRLLKEYLPAANFYATYQDISFISNPDQFLATRLANWQPSSPAEAPVTMGDLLAASHLDRPVALLLDEADKLMPVDRKLGWPMFSQLRSAANSGHLRVILIGERHLRESMQDSRSPLFNFTSDILIGRLNFENVEKLITQPLEKLEIIYDPAIVRRIYSFTSGHPNIVQRLCYQLIERLDARNDRKLTLDDVETVVNDPRFQQDDFLNTYLSQATLLERILTIVLAKADPGVYSLANIRQLLRQSLSLESSVRELNAALRRLVELRSILTHTPQGYVFAVEAIPLVINQSGTIATTDLLEQYVEDYREHGDQTLEDIEALEWA